MMDVSLDEIIKQNKITNQKNRRRNRPANKKNDNKKGSGGAAAGGGVKSLVTKRLGTQPARAGGVKKKKVTDLRLLIASGKSSKGVGGGSARGSGIIRDAREKLGKPSRLSEKLLSSRSPSISSEMLMRRARRGGGVPRRKLDSRKPAYMDLEEARLKRRPSGGSLLLYRTVDNDMDYLMLNDSYRSSGGGPLARSLPQSNRPAPTPLVPDSWLQPSIQDITRYQSQPLTRTFNLEDVWAQPQIPRRNSNGISAKRRLDREEEVSHSQGYRIVVSNLQSSVTHEDIKELFEDIGSLYSSRVVRPGTAEVVYKNMEDAVKAVDTYHNRQLDGQPMKCLLVKPSNMTSLVSKGSVVPDLHAIHKALFNK